MARRSTDDDFSENEPIANEAQSSRQRRLNYFQNAIGADCEVHVPYSNASNCGCDSNMCFRKYLCHRIFLATASERLEQDVFQNVNWNGVLQINGVSPESVEIFLEFIYTFEVTSAKVDLKYVGDIFILTCAYNMPDFLVQYCKRLRDVPWPIEGIFSAFNLAFRHNISELENVCLMKILENAQTLKNEASLMDLQIYAFNFVIQHWLVSQAVETEELIDILQHYQRANNLTFRNTNQFPHFTKIIRYFPTILLNADGLIR